jgi:hypothetical protein
VSTHAFATKLLVLIFAATSILVTPLFAIHPTVYSSPIRTAKYDVPHISSISPAVATAGSPGFTLLVLGSSLSGATVQWNGKSCPTTTISATQVKAIISTSQISSPATIAITARKSDVSSNTVTLVVASAVTPSVAAPAAVSIVTSSLTAATLNNAYQAMFSGTGGVAPYGWKLVSGSLPAGISLSESGMLSGTPTVAGQYGFGIQVTDSSSPAQSASKSFTLSVVAPSISPLSVTTTNLPGGTVASAYYASLAATGGQTPYSWSVASGSSPTGVTLSGSTLSGTPTQAGQFSFTIQVKDSSPTPLTASQSYSVSIASNVKPVTIATTSLPGGTVSTSYSTSLSAAGGTSPYTWSLASGALPPGLGLNTTGAISGTPTTAGQSSFTIQVKDSSPTPLTASQSYSVSIASSVAPVSIATTSLPGGTVSTSYSTSLSAAGGTSPYTWSLASGALPPGLGLNNMGAISGTPATAGQFSFVARVTDSSPTQQVSTASLAITVSNPVSNTPTTSTTYTSRTDLGPAPESVPPLCSPAPCTMTSSDLNTSLTYVRVTDSTTSPVQSGSMGPVDSGWEQDIWNSSATLFLVEDSGGGSLPITFNPSAFPSASSVAQLTCSSGSWCTSGKYRLGINYDARFSGSLPNVLFGVSGTTIRKVDLTNVISTGGPGSSCTLSGTCSSGELTNTFYDFSSCPGLPSTSGFWSFSGNRSDGRFSIMAGGSGQDTDTLLVVFDTAKGCRWLQTTTMTTGGQWGPTGAVTVYDPAGNVVPPTISSSSPYYPYLDGQLHNARMSLDGDLLFFTQQGTNGYVSWWDIADNIVYRCSINGTDNCIGHFYNAYDHRNINQAYANLIGQGTWTEARTLPPSGQTTPQIGCQNNATQCALITSPHFPTCGLGSLDGHFSWPNAQPGQDLPYFSGLYQSTAPSCAWADEITGVATDGSQTVWRFAHMYSRATSANYWTEAIYAVSRDGKWAVFGSNWGNGTGRSDAFLVPLK